MKTQKVVAALSDVDLFNNLMYVRMDGWELVKDTMRQEKTAVGVTIHVCIVEKDMASPVTQSDVADRKYLDNPPAPTRSPTVKLPAVNPNKDYPPINPNMISITVKQKQFPCIVCGNTTFLPDGECISCGHPEPR